MIFDPTKTVILFSHGFGVRQDARGLFTHLSKKLSTLGYKTKLFDYNKFDEKTKELFGLPFSAQAKILQDQIDELKRNSNYEDIVLIGHSQGSLIPALCNNISKVSKVIGISPFFHTNINDIRRRYTSKPGNILNFNGVSKRKRSDGSTTIIPPEYWQERFNTDVVSLYNDIAFKTKLTLIYAVDDQVMDFTDLRKILNTRIINVEGDHDLSSEYRKGLMDVIMWELDE
ncbi:hypothetical protein JW710_01210 [Candidatus Dojkabacteria bacterium]|nr:hypothetical protein [Candidatus Dojkabacteria bacterium]